MTDDLDPYVALALELADWARHTMLDSYRPDYAHSIKGDGSPVTELDQAIERGLRQMIESRFPDHGILGEEYGTVGIDREYLWVLDPIDGTKHFAAGLPDFGTLIALCRDGRPVIGIIELSLLGRRCLGIAGRPTTINGAAAHCRADRGLGEAILSSSGPDAFDGSSARDGFERLRRATAWNVYGGGCVGYVSLANGMVDLCLEGGLDPFDFCALVPVVEGAGGVVTDWEGKPLSIESGPRILAAGNESLHEEALSSLRAQ